MKTLEPTRPTRFLVVEDDDDHAEIVIRTLKKYSSHKIVDRAFDGIGMGLLKIKLCRTSSCSI
jgi:hypothetical protein